MTAPINTKTVRRGRPRQASAMSFAQLDLFDIANGDDETAAMDFLGRTDNAVAHMTDVVHAMTMSNPQLGAMVAGNTHDVSMAMYLRAGGMDLAEVSDFVSESSENPKAVMAMVAIADISPEAAQAYAKAREELGDQFAMPLPEHIDSGEQPGDPEGLLQADGEAPLVKKRRARGARTDKKTGKALKTGDDLVAADPDVAEVDVDDDGPLSDEPALAQDDLAREEVLAKKATAEHYRAMQGLMNRLRGDRYAPPSHAHALELGQRIQAGDEEARNELVERNTRLLVRLAARFRHTGRSLEDLFQAGSFGLIRAAEKFDPTKGFAFSTYADAWIRSSISRYLAGDEIIRTPTHIRDQEFSVRKRAREATNAGDRALAERLEAQADEMKRQRPTENNFSSTDAKIFGEGDDRTISDLLASEEMGLDQALEAKKLVAWLLKASNGTMNEMHGEVFQMRLGLHPDYENQPLSLVEIGEIFQISREHVRVVFEKALNEVRADVVRWAKGEENLPDNFFPMLKAMAGRS